MLVCNLLLKLSGHLQIHSILQAGCGLNFAFLKKVDILLCKRPLPGIPFGHRRFNDQLAGD
tara:strand:- start:1307 stop:1489 length:183 start_codon:yes stop_codon:yes gene_type:complete